MKNNNMNIEINQLRKTPVKSNPKFLFEDYWDNKRFYQENIISQIQVSLDHPISQEELKDCDDYGLLYENYYCKSKLVAECEGVKKYLSKKVYLRESILKSIAKVDDYLQKHGLRLLIMSGYRHPELQHIILKRAAEKHGSQKAEQMLANPVYYSPHATGGVFDVEVWDLQKDKMLPTKINGDCNRYYLEKKKYLSIQEKNVLGNRRLIHSVLSSTVVLGSDEIFVPHPYEYWHYGRNERLSAFFSGIDHPIYYDEIY